MHDQVRRLARGFATDDWPSLQCPICHRGTLRTSDGSVRWHANRATAHWEDWGCPTDIEGTFSGDLACDNQFCGDHIAVGGDFGVDPSAYDGGYENILTIRTLYPPVEVIAAPDGVPQTVKSELSRAAGVAWLDPAAGVSLLRAAVERLMDEHNVTPTRPNGRFRPLHERLTEFESSGADPAACELLIAAKWVGNEGAHPGNLSIDDFLDVAEMVELALEILYPNQRDTTAITARAGRIIAAKKMVP